MSRRLLPSLVFFLVIGLALTGCSGRSTSLPAQEELAAQPSQTEPTLEPVVLEGAASQTLFEILEGNESFSTFLSIAETTGFAGTLKAPGPITVFVPTNEAFDKLPPASKDDLLSDTEQMVALVKFHAIANDATSDQLKLMTSVPSLLGTELSLRTQNDEVLVNGARLTQPDLKATNGVAHGIDTVLIP